MGFLEAVSFLTELHVKGRDTYWKVRQAVENDFSHDQASKAREVMFEALADRYTVIVE